MCGIAGIIDPDLSAPALEPIVQQMIDSLVHRGPDDSGLFCTDGAGIGMRRLSIIDLKRGHQPMASEDGKVVAINNGEIYNFRELRADLEKHGHHFQSLSDTEVLVHNYEEDSERFPESLRGMFATAIWDRPRQALILTRDRLGKKPLFYAQTGQRLLFASEIKAILAVAPELAELDPDAIAPYFRFGFICEPRTAFRRIRKLPAGHRLVFRNNKASITPYWTLPLYKEEAPRRTEQQWVNAVNDALLESVRLRLESDVPLGVFLSGGIDSCAIAATMRRAGAAPLRTYTIGFDRPEWDESTTAAEVAGHLETEHHLLMLAEHEMKENLPGTLLNLVRHFDEPVGDSSALPSWHVSRLARQHVKVILSGDGGDELFAGYTTSQGIRFAEKYRRLPSWLRQGALPAAARGLAWLLPPGRKYRALRMAKVLRDSNRPFQEMYWSKMALCSDDLLQRLLTPEALGEKAGNDCFPPGLIAALNSNAPPLARAGYADIRFRLLEDMLVKVDRMSMAHGLEVRCPFLDHRLVELAASIPPNLKLRGWERKAILRDAVRPLLPATIFHRPKQGFSIPLREWLRTELAEVVSDYLESDSSKLSPELFHPDAVRVVIQEHRQGLADHSQAIWSLLTFAAWQELYLS